MKNNEVEMEKEEKKETTVGRRSAKRVEQTGKKKTKKMDIVDRILAILLILSVLELLMIPGFIYAGMNQIFPIIMFIVLPTVFAFVILLLSRNTLMESRKKARRKQETSDEN